MALAGLFLVFSLTASAYSQTARTAHIALKHNTDRIFIGEKIYITEDPDQKLTDQVVISRHENNLRGHRSQSALINFGTNTPRIWIVFSIMNDSNAEEWLLHFGKVSDGRYALAKNITLRNDTTGEVLANKNTQERNSTKDFQGLAIPIHIEKNKTNLFIMSLELDKTLPGFIAPSLISKKHYMNMLYFGDIISILETSFLIGLGAFFIAIMIMKRNPHYLLFSIYYLFHLAILFLLNTFFFAEFSLINELIFFFYIASLLLGLGLTRFFLEITLEDYPENPFIFTLGGFVLLVGTLSVVLSQQIPFSDFLLFFIACLTTLCISFLSFMQAQRGKRAAYYYTGAWLCLFAGVFITGLGMAGLLPANALILNAYWLALFLQAPLFIAGVIKRNQVYEEEELYLQTRENRAAQSLERLKQSKESADQARLLRVIERERELMAELREREMQRTEEMRQAKDMADEANRAKSAFLAVVSHEIRTPMTGIMGMIQLLLNTKMTKQQHEYATAVQKSGETMMGLLNDILDFEKIESGNMELEYIDFDLPRLIHGVATLMSGHAAEKETTLAADIAEGLPPIFVGDPTRLRQVLLNLVSNAIKFTASGQVKIIVKSITSPEMQSKNPDFYQIYFAVEDTGIGISEEARQRLFEPFSQAEKSTARKYGGTGLGLTICRRLVEAMGGEIHVKSVEGEGSTFSFSITIKKGYEDSTGKSSPDNTIAHKIKETPPLNILVIEDNEMNRKVLQGFLEKDQHSVTLADSGETALEICRRKTFDLIFSDVNLSGMSGIETTKTLRFAPDKKIASTPVIALTGNVSASDIESYYAANMNGFLAKPIDPEKLSEILYKASKHEFVQPVILPEQNKKPAEPSHDIADPSPLVQETPLLQEPVLDEEMKEDSNDIKSDDDIAPIQKFVTNKPQTSGESDERHKTEERKETEDLLHEDLDFDSFEDATQISQQSIAQFPAPSNLFDKNMLENLLKTLGKEPLQDLLNGFWKKAEEIIESLEKAEMNKDMQALHAHAHELKGMAANFGFPGLSAIAANIENNTKHDDTAKKTIEETIADIKRLPGQYREAFEALQKWMESA